MSRKGVLGWHLQVVCHGCALKLKGRAAWCHSASSANQGTFRIGARPFDDLTSR